MVSRGKFSLQCLHCDGLLGHDIHAHRLLIECTMNNREILVQKLINNLTHVRKSTNPIFILSHCLFRVSSTGGGGGGGFPS